MATAEQDTVPLHEVQGIILRGYEFLRAARFLHLDIQDPAAARTWLQDSLKNNVLTNAQHRPDGEKIKTAVNIAFTFSGLQRLGLDEKAFPGFSREFQEGVDTPHRQRVLGDTGKGEPSAWEWGMKADPRPVHILLMLYAVNDEELNALDRRETDRLTRSGLALIRTLGTTIIKGRKEQFGFRDGIAQPLILGVNKEKPVAAVESRDPGNRIMPGEFLLGFPNEYGRYSASPVLPAGENSFKNFGHCGSYLVSRQLHQDVHAFWAYADEATRREGQTPEEHREARIALAAKMVGRWPSGCPLALSPLKDNPELFDADTYGFYEKDPLGVAVPIGSHTRRANPRDSLEPGPGQKDKLGRDESLRVTKLHRMIRRSRPYGPLIAESMDSDDILRAPADTVGRGLQFLCFNVSIARQFEFVQQTWINNPKFGGLYGDADPIMGQRQPEQLPAADTFTEQGVPVRRRYRTLSEFVWVRGGAYFFMPGMEALKHLAGLEANLPSCTAEGLPPSTGPALPSGERRS